MSKKLTTITPTYHAFAKDQLLTHTDLNEVIDYFEDQDRLSRICLSGVGIVCGFKPTFITGTNTLAISQGSGITTDGDLVHFLFDSVGENSLVDHSAFTGLSKTIDYLKLSKYRTFTDSNAGYEQFQYDSGAGQIPLIELLPESSSGTPIENDNIFADRTLLIYLDCYSKEAGACTAISCDSQGVEQVRVLRVLLVNDIDIDTVNKHDYLFNANDIAQDYLSLLPVGVPRVIVTDNNADNLNELANQYETAVLGTDSFGNNMLSNLINGVNTICTKVEYGSQTNLLDGINNALNLTTLNNSLFQYRYDLFKDLVDSFNELRCLFIEHYPNCCPDIYPFPKHLLLGTLDKVGTLEELPTEEIQQEDNPNRHRFYPSPILTNHYSARQHLIAVLERMLLMVENFSAFTGSSSDDIQITPSNLREALGKRAIPFYYDPQYDANSKSRFVRFWDFNRRTLRRYDEILGYNQANESSNPLVIRPLEYNLENFNFFRIEGHQGLLYQDALERVNQIRDQYALGFDTKVLGISVDAAQSINIDDYTCDFVDLQGQLESCIDMQNCLFEFASSLLSGYSIDPVQEGFNNNTTSLMGRQSIFTVAPDLTLLADVVRNDQTSETSGTTSGTASSSSSETPVYYASRSSTTTQSSTETQYYANRSAETSPSSSSTAASNSSTTESAPQVNLGVAAMELQVQLGLAGAGDLVDFDNPIIKNLYAENDGLGSIVLNAFQGYLGTDSETTYQAMKFQIDNLVGGDLQGWNDDITEAHLYMPAKILSSAYAASLMMPVDLPSLTPALITNYQSEVERLCSYVRQYQSSYETLRATQNTSVNNDLYALSELLSGNMASLCCAGDKLESILDQIDARKLEILTNLELSRFAQDHPGIEHMAGVPNGGTFIMAYAFNETGTGAVQDGTVIADFALPYLCCSDCRPVNFIVPKNVVSLVLSSSVVCIDTTSTEPVTIDMIVTPTGAPVAFLNPIPGVSIDGNVITITPDAFDPVNFNSPLELTVNGQYTSATLTIVEPRAVSISSILPAVEEGVPTSNTNFTFYASGYEDGDTITWDFGDGTLTSFTAPAGASVSHNYNLPLPNDAAVIRLTVSPANGSCNAVAEANISFSAVTVSIDKNVFCLDEPEYPLTIVPADSSPNVTGAGVTADYKFAPGTAGVGQHTLFLDGTEFATVQVIQPPTINDDPSVTYVKQGDGNKTVDLMAKFEGSENATWSFHPLGNTDVSLVSPPPITGVLSGVLNQVSTQEFGFDRPTTITILLTVFPPEGSPCQPTTKAFRYEVNVLTADEGTPQDETSKDDSGGTIGSEEPPAETN